MKFSTSMELKKFFLIEKKKTNYFKYSNKTFFQHAKTNNSIVFRSTNNILSILIDFPNHLIQIKHTH